MLQVQPDAPVEIIKSSYRTLKQKLRTHPDLGGDQWNAALINGAYAVLSNPETCAQYDAQRRNLKKPVGAGARDVANDAPSELNRSLAARASTSEDFLEQGHDSSLCTPNDPRICAFCGVRKPTGDYQAPGDICHNCASPMRLVEVTTGRDRGARRIEHQGRIHVQEDAKRPDTYLATVVDLSPIGLRFMSQHHLQRGHVVKLDSPTLSAVAVVTYSTAKQANGQFSTGVRFLTFKPVKLRGTFVSAKT